MELRIDLNNPKEIVFGLNLLNSLALAVRAQQEAELGAARVEAATSAARAKANGTNIFDAPAAEPDVTEQQVVRETTVRETTEVGDCRHTTEVVTKEPAPAEDAPKKRGRPKKEKTAKQQTAEAIAQPVGAVLAGVPARDLAAALQPDAASDALADEHAVAQIMVESDEAPAEEEAPQDDVVVHTDPDTPAADVEALKAELTAQAAKHLGRDFSGGFSVSDLELFADPEPAAAPVDPYAGKSVEELYVMWRKEASERPIHWGRAIVKRYNIRGQEDMTRDILVEALTHPEIYMPPAVA